MPTRERPPDRGRRTTRGALVRVLEDIHGARIAAGLAVIRASLRDTLPLDCRAILHALRRGRDPGGDGIVLM